MTSVVHYKFHSAASQSRGDTVAFEGASITVADVKREIIKQKNLRRINGVGFDLILTDTQTGERQCTAARSARPLFLFS